MFTVFQTIYRSFYDKTLGRDYVRDGNGMGFPVLGTLTVLMALLFSVRTFGLLSFITPDVIASFSEKMPDITINRGRIETTPAAHSQILLSQNLTLTVDTSVTADPITAPPPGIYLYQKSLAFSDTNGRITHMPLENIFGAGKVVVSPQKTKAFLTDFVPYSRKVVPILVGIVGLPLFFFKIALITYLLSLLAFIPLGYFQMELDFPKRMRLATISVLPALLLSVILNTFALRFYGGMVTEILISLMYMVYFLFPVAPRQNTNDMAEN